jgi:hypothetical protein
MQTAAGCAGGAFVAARGTRRRSGTAAEVPDHSQAAWPWSRPQVPQQYPEESLKTFTDRGKVGWRIPQSKEGGSS